MAENTEVVLTGRDRRAFAVGGVLVALFVVVGILSGRQAAPLADRCLQAARAQGLVGARWNPAGQTVSGSLVQPGLTLPVVAGCTPDGSGVRLQIAR